MSVIGKKAKERAKKVREKEREMEEITERYVYEEDEPMSDDSFFSLLGQKLKEVRIDMGYTMKDLHEISGISTSYLSFLERGMRNPSIHILWEISLALKCPIHLFIPTELELEVHKIWRSEIEERRAEIAADIIEPRKRDKLYPAEEMNRGGY